MWWTRCGARRASNCWTTGLDPDHNRSVLTYLGQPEPVLAATMALAARAFDLIDMTQHHGTHPRQGAVDVVPFIPVRGVETAEAVAIARRFGQYVGSLGVPVYYYEDAATRPERATLPAIRKGEYEALPAKLLDPAWLPDAGPATFNPKAGRWSRAPASPDRVQRQPAHNRRRHRGPDRQGRALHQRRLPLRAALGLPLEDKGLVQVSMNLINYAKTPIPRVLETIPPRRRATALPSPAPNWWDRCPWARWKRS